MTMKNNVKFKRPSIISHYQQKIQNTHYTIVYNGDQSDKPWYGLENIDQGDNKQLIHAKSIRERSEE